MFFVQFCLFKKFHGKQLLTLSQYSYYHNIRTLILRFNCFTNTASDTVQLKPAVKSLLKSTDPLYLIPFLPKSVVTGGI